MCKSWAYIVEASEHAEYPSTWQDALSPDTFDSTPGISHTDIFPISFLFSSRYRRRFPLNVRMFTFIFRFIKNQDLRLRKMVSWHRTEMDLACFTLKPFRTLFISRFQKPERFSFWICVRRWWIGLITLIKLNRSWKRREQ